MPLNALLQWYLPTSYCVLCFAIFVCDCTLHSAQPSFELALQLLFFSPKAKRNSVTTVAQEQCNSLSYCILRFASEFALKLFTFSPGPNNSVTTVAIAFANFIFPLTLCFLLCPRPQFDNLLHCTSAAIVFNTKYQISGNSYQTSF